MDAIITAISPVLIVASAGFLLRRFIELDARTLSTLNIYLFIPALVYSKLSLFTIDWTLFSAIAGAAVLMVVVMTAFLHALGLWMKLERDRRSAFTMTQFMNLGNFGLPVALFAFGDEGLALAVVVMVCGSLLQNSIGLYFVQRSSHGAWKAFQRVFHYPLVYAILLALISQKTRWFPIAPFRLGIDLVADAAIPVQLMILGIKLAETRLEVSRLVFTATAIRLVLGPVAAFGLAWLVGLEGLPAKVFILMMSGPVAVGMAVFGVQFNVQPRFLASAVSWSFLFSLISVGTVLYLLEHVPWLT